MRLFWHDAAALEFEEAALYYGEIDRELAHQFTSAVDFAIACIVARPGLARKFDGEARKVRLERFPYAVIYGIQGATLHIVAVMHLHREPGYWRNRMQ